MLATPPISRPPSPPPSQSYSGPGVYSSYDGGGRGGNGSYNGGGGGNASYGLDSSVNSAPGAVGDTSTDRIAALKRIQRRSHMWVLRSGFRA